GGQKPDAPIVFVKVRGSVAPPGGPVVCPEVVRRLDYEGELTIVMGAGGEIAGYCVADDATTRDLQGREPQWTRAKGADTFCPWGPWITTSDEVGDPGALRLRTWVNEELRQDASTADLIFGVDDLVAFLAETQPLAHREHLAGVDVDVGGLPLEARGGLVDDDPAVGQREALALGAAGQQQRAHRGGDPEADRRHVGLDELHGVVDREARVDVAAG